MRRRRMRALFVLGCALLSCERFSLPESTYEFFEVTDAPEERVWYPEETIVFRFNEAIDPGTVDAVDIAYEGDPAHTTVVRVEQETLLIEGMLPDATLSVTLASGLKSATHKPLVVRNDGGYDSGPLTFPFAIGPAFPAVIHMIPGEKLRSENIALRFTGPIDTSDMTADPTPAITATDGDTLLLSFDSAPTRLTLSGITSPVRPGTLPDLTFSFSEDTAASTEPVVTETLFDSAVSFSITGTGLVAASIDDTITPCDGACALIREGLSPDTEYSFDIVLYRTDGRSTLTRTVATLPPAPHIMISEVMHTPSGDPEKNWEFVELYNYGELAFDLAGCTIDDRDDGAGEDPLIPLTADDTIIEPGGTALILGSESTLHLTIAAAPHLFFVDDTTIADGGLTSTESIQIHCIVNETVSREASYDGLFKGTERGYSVVIDTAGRICASAAAGGSPGLPEECPAD